MKTQNRKEIFLKALANGEEPNIKPLTREEVLLKKQAERESAGGGGDCDWNLMKNKPFWKEIEKEEILPEIVVITEYNSDLGYNVAAKTRLSKEEGMSYIVVLNGVEYECTAYNDSNFGETVIGSTDFSEYPFFAIGNVFITENAGEYTVKQYALLDTVQFGYLPYLSIITEMTPDRIPYIAMGDVEEIKRAYKNGIPIRLKTNHGLLGLTMQVNEVSGSFIFASYCGNTSIGLVETTHYQFLLEDGSLYRSGHSVSGTIRENDNSFPVMYCNNRAYKINIDSSGNLKATEITS